LKLKFGSKKAIQLHIGNQIVITHFYIEAAHGPSKLFLHGVYVLYFLCLINCLHLCFLLFFILSSHINHGLLGTLILIFLWFLIILKYFSQKLVGDSELKHSYILFYYVKFPFIYSIQ